MKPQLTLEAFAEFCERKPVHEEYCWIDDDNCAAAQYAQSLGLIDQWQARRAGSFWRRCSVEAYRCKESTFGTLAKRLRAASPYGEEED